MQVLVACVTFDQFRRMEEHLKSWRYSDPFFGSLFVPKAELPDPPPERVTVAIEYAGQAGQ
jgi:hypothetical protein